MKISFPYMGCVTGIKKVLEVLGHEVIEPLKPTQRTIDLGVKYSPEFICYPFKIMMGTYIEACEAGAQLIISSGGSGPCRAGYYGEIHKRILKSLGFDVELIIFDSIFQDFAGFWRKLMLVKNKTRLSKLLKGVILGLKMIAQLDDIQKKTKILRAYEIEKGETNKVYQKILALHDKCYDLKTLKKLKLKSEDMLDSIPVRIVPKKDRIRVGIVGEIFVIMESTTNNEIEERLNYLGCEVYNVQYLSDWLRHNLIPKRYSKERSVKVLKKSDKYTKINCGGHDKENMGWIVDFAERKFDAVVHVMPFSCLPELISRTIIPQMSDDLNMPILSVSMDEQTGSANIQTRLEAFIDLVKNKKNYIIKHEKIEENNLAFR